ncbi:MAG TPA: PAS domain S-box protein [Rhodothermales bacterium]
MDRNADGMKTLVLANEPEISREIERELESRDHRIFLATSFEDAWAIYEAELPSIVMTAALDDDSLRLCRSVSAQARSTSVTVLMVVARDKGHLLPDVIEAGADDYVLSPLAPERLHIRLDLAEKRVREMESRAAVERELEVRVSQQAVVSELGILALGATSPTQIMQRAVQAVMEGLGVQFVKVLEILPDKNLLLLRAGAGWQKSRVGSATVAMGRGSQAGYTLMSGEPVVVQDMATETRFDATSLLSEHRVVSGVSVVIARGSVPYGVLSAHTAVRRSFSIDDIHFMQAIANVIGVTIERSHSETALRESEARARAIVETTVDGIITIDDIGTIESFNTAAERIFGYVATEVIGQNISVLMPPPYREEHDGYLRSYRESGRKQIIGIGREVAGLRKDGSVFPMELAVSEVALDGRRLFTGIVRDITERRRMEQEVLDISEQERRRIGQDLHDGLGQMLTGITLITQNLARKLKNEGNPIADDLFEITDLVKEADQHARGLARGLVPVELDAKGLADALRRLADQAERLFGISCGFEEVGSTLLYDNTAATHLFRISQEAVSNAVKHGKATRITIRLASGEDQIRIRIQDNGVGIPEELPEHRGMGVRIMHHRARMIGGTLEIRRAASGGTIVVCTVLRRRAVARVSAPLALRED